MESLKGRSPTHAPVSEYGFDLRAEPECMLVGLVKEWLYSISVPGEMEPLASIIPNCHGEHAVELLKHFEAEFFVKVE
jgi:hypothetical protein